MQFLKLAALFSLLVFISSCSIEYMSWKPSDPFDDEEDLKITKVENKNENKNRKNEQTVIPPQKETQENTDEIVELPDIYEVSCDISLEEADLILRSSLEGKNYKIIHVSHVTKGMEEQGRTDFWKDMNIYMICRLSDGYDVLKHNPWLVGMCPMRIYTYRNEEGKLVIGMFRPSLAAKWMGNPDMKAYEVLRTYDKQLKEAIDSVCQK